MKQNARVLHLNAINNLAGACRSMNTLVRELADQSPVFVVTLFDNKVAEVSREAGAEVRSLFSGEQLPSSRLMRFWRATRVLSKAIKDWNIDLLHVHTANGMRYAWLAAKWHGIPIVCHQRDNYAKDNYHRGLGKADHIISISKWVEKGLAENLQKKTTVIYNAVYLPDESQCTDGFKNSVLTIGYAGRCFHEKGIDLLVDAIELLEHRKDFRIKLVGIPEIESQNASDDKKAPEANDLVNQYAKDIRSKIALLPMDLQDRVCIQPFQEEIADFYQETDIVVVPSRYAEPLGRMAIEAMAWQCVAVVANHGGLSEIVDHGETGLVFEPGSAEDLAKQLNLLLEDRSLCSKLARAGRIVVSDKFSPLSHAKEVQSVYVQVLDKGII